MEWIPTNHSYYVQSMCFYKEYQGRIRNALVLLQANRAVLVKIMYVWVYSERNLMCLKLVEMSIALKIWPIKQARKRHNNFGEYIFHVEIMTLNLLQSSQNIKICMYIISIWLTVILIIITIFLILYIQVHKKVDNVALTCLNL